MIISHKYRFIFIATKKTASSSIETYPAPHLGPDDVLTDDVVEATNSRFTARSYLGLWNPLPELIFERSPRRLLADLSTRTRFIKHLPARIARWRMPKDTWQGYFKFCVERNPWDRTVSNYFWEIKGFGLHNMTFDEYIVKGQTGRSFPLYTDKQGISLVDRVLMYERLDGELSEVFTMLGVPFAGSLNQRRKSQYRPAAKPYQAMFTAEQRDIVARLSAPEIAMFGYTFDEGSHGDHLTPA